MNRFEEMALPESMIHILSQVLKFDDPTPIQSEAIPVALEGRDIIGSAQTGTGKTGAFGIPLVSKLLSDPSGTALVITPTRELATQVMGQLRSLLSKKTKIKSALLIGGEPVPKQLNQLRNSPRIIVGTPGRINDHLQRSSLKLNNTNYLVLDETDRMLDMGFSIQIDAIMEYMPTNRQTLLFSATLPTNIIKIAEKYLTDPVRIAVSPTSTPANNINQETINISDADKYPMLLSQLNKRNGSIVVFVKTKYGADKMAINLKKDGHNACAIHGDLRQNKRDRVIDNFRKQKYRILVATDVAARGLDIPHIEHVINYDLPQCAEDYIHRIGRTARAGSKGSALNFVSPNEQHKWNAIDYLLDPKGKKKPKDPKANNSNKKRRNNFKRTAKGKSNMATVHNRNSNNKRRKNTKKARAA
ncbi:MAG: DEAD/DEAH box helicase [Pseudomonadota bacterium]